MAVPDPLLPVVRRRLELEALIQVGVVGTGYIVLRMVGRIGGTYVGGSIVGVEAKTRRWMGVALMPEAGSPWAWRCWRCRRSPGTRT